MVVGDHFAVLIRGADSPSDQGQRQYGVDDPRHASGRTECKELRKHLAGRAIEQRLTSPSANRM